MLKNDGTLQVLDDPHLLSQVRHFGCARAHVCSRYRLHPYRQRCLGSQYWPMMSSNFQDGRQIRTNQIITCAPWNAAWHWKKKRNKTRRAARITHIIFFADQIFRLCWALLCLKKRTETWSQQQISFRHSADQKVHQFIFKRHNVKGTVPSGNLTVNVAIENGHVS